MCCLSASDVTQPVLFWEPARLCMLFINHGGILRQSYYMVVFNIHKWGMAVDHRHSKIVVETQLEWSRFKRLVPIDAIMITKTQMPLSTGDSGIASSFNYVANVGAG